MTYCNTIFHQTLRLIPGEHVSPQEEGHGMLAQGVILRHDHGSQYLQAEIAFLGIAGFPPFVLVSEGNSWSERFIRIFKEKLH